MLTQYMNIPANTPSTRYLKAAKHILKYRKNTYLIKLIEAVTWSTGTLFKYSMLLVCLAKGNFCVCMLLLFPWSDCTTLTWTG